MSPTILIVDDSPVNLKLVSQVLIWDGYEVLQAESAEAALVLLRSEEPDLLLLDMQLPGMDGMSLARLLRQGEKTRDLPILALSAHAMKGDIEKAFAAGCDGYMTKPIDTRTFSTEIARYLKRNASLAA